MPTPSPLSAAQTRALEASLGVVRDQRRRVREEGAPLDPVQAWSTPFGLGYLLGVVDGMCQAHGAAFDAHGLAMYGLVLDDTFGRPRSDALRRLAVRHLQAGHADLARGRQWGGNEAIGQTRGLAVAVGLVLLARGDEGRMGGPVGRVGPAGGLA